MPAFAAVLATVVLGILAVLQAALALGAPLGRFAWGGKHRVLPAGLRVGSALSIPIYAVIAVVLLARAGVLPLLVGSPVVDVAAWAVFGYLVLAVLMNAVSRSRPERYAMTPASIVLAVCALLVALG